MSWLSDLLGRLGGGSARTSTRISLGGDDDEVRDRDRDGIPDEFDTRDDRAEADNDKDDGSGDSDDSDGGGDDGGSDD